MAVTIEIAGIRATISGRVWKSQDKGLAGVLNALINPLELSAAYPDIDLAIAQDAVERLGGVIVEADPPEPIDENVVY